MPPLNARERLDVQVLYGMDYLSSERDQQHAFLRGAVLDHLRRAPTALLVIEEYDKLDCPTRAMLRQLIGSSRAGNTSMARCLHPESHADHRSGPTAPLLELCAASVHQALREDMDLIERTPKSRHQATFVSNVARALMAD